MSDHSEERRAECSRRQHDYLMRDDNAIEEIAERAAKKAVAKMTDNLYKDIGRGVVAKTTWIVGVVTVGMYFWLQGKGFIK